MATYVDLVDEAVNVDTSKDSIVIIENIVSLRGGRSLDVTGFAPDVINAGHVIIRETATGTYKPMPINSGATAYETLPGGHTYVGVLVATILKKRPFAGVMTWGVVNEVASPFPVSTIKSAFLTAVNNHIEFTSDLA